MRGTLFFFFFFFFSLIKSQVNGEQVLFLPSTIRKEKQMVGCALEKDKLLNRFGEDDPW